MKEGKRKRGTGCIYRPKKSPYWWIAYPGPQPGKPVRESTQETDRNKAEEYLDNRLRQVANDKDAIAVFVKPIRLTVTDLLDSLEADLRIRMKQEKAGSHMEHLRQVLGRLKARNVVRKTIQAYQETRRKEGAAPSTIDKEKALLVQAFTFGKENEQVAKVPTAPNLLKLHENARKFFVDTPKLAELLDAIRAESPDLADWSEWFGVTGMRNRETSTLEWRDYDETGEFPTLTVRAENAKLREDRKVPVVGPLVSIIERRTLARRPDCRLVFHADGRSLDKHGAHGLPKWAMEVWRRACAKVGAPNLEPYDLRRHAARSLRDAGVPESVSVEIMGQKTSSMFRRYAITDDRDKARALESVGVWTAEQRKKRSKVTVGNFGVSA